MKKNIALLCYPTPGNKKAIAIADDLHLLLTAKGYTHSLFVDNWPIVWAGYTEAWIIGGDGTLNYFINRYHDFHLPITIFKGGSGNDFHWMLFGDITHLQQADRILCGSVEYLDAGMCNNRLFLNGVGIGFDGAVVKDLYGRKKFGGKTSYMVSILKHVLFYKEQSYEIITDSTTICRRCFLISVANGKRYGGGFTVAPEASVRDGLLDLNTVGKIPALKRIKYLPVLEKGEHLKLPFVQYEQVAKVIIRTPQRVHAHIDGEYLFTDYFEVACLPKRILFIV